MVACWRTAREGALCLKIAAGYAGDVSAKAAWEALSQSPEATLVDVRTTAEWVYVGVPVLAAIGKAPSLVEWDEFPSGELVPDFVGRLTAELDKRGIGRDAPLYFICRSGNRSRHAAIAATAAGYRAFLQRRIRLRGPARARSSSRHRRKLEGGGPAMGAIMMRREVVQDSQAISEPARQSARRDRGAALGRRAWPAADAAGTI